MEVIVPQSKQPHVDIIIPNFNGRSLLPDCIASIARQIHLSHSIWLVDNGSTDGSAEYVRKCHPEVNIISLPVNKGFSAAVNEGIRKAQGDYVCLLNNDIELDPRFLSELISALEARPDVDYCAPKMLNYHQRDILDGAGDFIFRSGAGYRMGTQEPDSERFDQERIVFGACAGAALYRRSFFDKVGLFDEDFFAYLEDVDLNLRANLLGLKCLYVPSARAYHMGSATTGGAFNPVMVRYSIRNIFNVVAKNFPGPALVRSIPFIFLYHAYWIIVALKRKQLRSYLRGVAEFLNGWPKMLNKRSSILANRKISDQAFWKMILDSEKEIFSSILRRRKTAGRVTWPLQIYLKLSDRH